MNSFCGSKISDTGAGEIKLIRTARQKQKDKVVADMGKVNQPQPNL